MADTNTLNQLAQEVALADDIRDIRPLVDVPQYWMWLWIGLAVLASLLVGWWLWRRWQARVQAEPVVPTIPAPVRARQRLEAALAWLEQPKPFVTAVSDALRDYLEEAFQLRAPEQTTEEFLVALQESAMLSPQQKSSLRDFLESCDMVKFAKYEPLDSELRELHGYALQLVSQTEDTPTTAVETQ